MKKFTSNKKSRSIGYLFLLFVVAILVGCSGGSGGGCADDDSCPGDIIGTGIRGTAAIGEPLANVTITVKSKSGAIKTVTSDANGKFEITELADQGPYLLRAENGNGKFLYSVAHKGENDTINRNIHPYTDLIIQNWFETREQSIDSVFSGNTPIPDMPTEQQVNAIKSEVHSIVAQVLARNGAVDIDLLSTPFDANGTGFDAFLDNSPVIINNNQITVVINDPVTNIQNVIINGISLDADLTTSNDSEPTTPKNVRALPAGPTEILVAWEASTDDKGVAGYNIFRNGTLVGTTPYPVFTDKGLSANTNYSYEVEAVDGRGQKSAKSTATASIMLDEPDIMAPPVPTELTSAATGNNIHLGWIQEQVNDVFGFRILRGSRGNVTAEIAKVTSTSYMDFDLAPATEYCYKVAAYDAVGNESAASEESCITTGGTISGPSTVSFSAAAYSVSENSSSITITVSRSGDISKPVSVDYSASPGTAADGEDFSAVSGTLSWAANDGSAKTFEVQIISDSATEGDETVNLTLSNPSADTAIGTDATAILTIIDYVVGVCNGEITNSTITEDTMLSEPCYKVPNGIRVENPAKLTISPGVRLEFAAGTKLQVNKGASLYAVGQQDQPIVITAMEATPGYWGGIEFYRSNSINNQLDYVTVEYGVINIGTVSFPSDPARLSIRNTVSRYASDLGIYIYDSSVQLGAFENNTLTLNDRPVSLPAEMVGMLGSDSRYSGNTDDRIHVFDQDIVTAQTWKKLDVLYYMQDGSRYDIDAALIIEAGVLLEFNSGSKLQISSSGSLKAIGTMAAPILFTGLEKTPGYWDGIEFYRSNSTNNQLDYVTVEYGVINIGTVSFPSAPARLSIRNTVSRYASDLGMHIYDSSVQLVSFENNTLTLNDRPVILPAEMVGVLGSDSQYSGNTDDRIHVFDQDIVTAQTWKKLDVPYYMQDSSRYDVDAALIIDAGVSLEFNSGSKLQVSSSGSLKAIGTETDPVLFTGLEQVPGYWGGIEFYRSNSTDNQLDYVIVEYAGAGDPSSSGNITSVCFPSTPTRFSVTNSVIKDSFGWGVYRYGGESDGCYITLTNNTYSNNASGDF